MKSRFQALPLALLSAVLSVLLASLTSCVVEPRGYAGVGSDVASDVASDVGNTNVVVNKSPNDNRRYRFLILPNQLRVLLISDPATDTAAASLTVFRGSLDEPAEFPGLAHFLEHMLFIATDKYPAIDAYGAFIAANGGSTNAYTAGDHTHYYFDVVPAALRPAMDRFAQFFIAPRLDPGYVDREKNAVDSEYQSQSKDDGWRGNAAFKAAMNPDYPGSRFTIGSLETLGDGVQGALISFFDSQYSANQMALVVLSSESLDRLAKWLAPLFAKLPNKNLEYRKATVQAFTESQLPLTLYFRPLKNERRVSFNFPVADTAPHYRRKPEDYIANLLGHEGAGSLHHVLTDRGWIEWLSAGDTRLDAANSFINVDMGLTEIGAQHVDDITDLLFAYIDLLKSNEPELWRYTEQATVAELGFRFFEQSTAAEFVSALSPEFALYPPEDVISANFLMEEFDPGLIKSYLARLTPANLVREIVAPDVATDQVEPWFGAPYRVDFGIDPDVPAINQATAAGLALPTPNPFLPERLELVTDDPAGPELAVKTPALELWIDTDTEFGVPRANLFVTLGVAGGFSTPRDLVLAQLYRNLVTDALNKYAYPAFLAGVGYDLSVGSRGFNLRLAGYDDKQPELLSAVLETFARLDIDATKFERIRQELLRSWRNFKLDTPYLQTYGAINHLLLSSSWPPEALAAAVTTATPADLESWRRKRLDGFRIRGLVHGNVLPSFAGELHVLLERALTLKSFALAEPRVTTIEESLLLDMPIDHGDASMVLYVQDDDASFAARAKSALAIQLLEQAYFSSLRTERQLGYVVAATNHTVHDHGGLAFIVQSPVASPIKLEQATRDFMAERLPIIGAMSEAELEDHRAGIIARLTKRDKNLNERSQRFWKELNLENPSFDTARKIATEVANIDHGEMMAYLKSVTHRLSATRLLISNTGKFDEQPAEGRQIPSIVAFKNGVLSRDAGSIEAVATEDPLTPITEN